jgi:hypothetical protein
VSGGSGVGEGLEVVCWEMGWKWRGWKWCKGGNDVKGIGGVSGIGWKWCVEGGLAYRGFWQGVARVVPDAVAESWAERVLMEEGGFS